ncbi:MAG: 30S ribosomal protein S16 [Saprospiraceae bacterium]
MAVKIRLQRKGRKKAPYYHIVVADARAPRDGKYISKIGMYNPISKPATIEIDRDKAFEWIMQGAQPTDTVLAILRYKGIMHRKHLQLGVTKGALTQETADAKYQDWIIKKEGKILDAINKNKETISDYYTKMISVTKVKKEKVDEPIASEEPIVEASVNSAEPVADIPEVIANNDGASDPEITKTNDLKE